MAHLVNILKNPKCKGFKILADEKNLTIQRSSRQRLFSSFGLGDIHFSDFVLSSFIFKISTLYYRMQW